MKYLPLGLIWATLASARFPSPQEPYNRLAPRQSGIVWQPCFDDVALQCGRFDVPLDYNNPAAGKATLAVIRYLSKNTPRLGTLFTNPGGPGGSGVEFIRYDGERLSNLTGGQYDIISWDPRGVKDTNPRIRCFTSHLDRIAFWGKSSLLLGLEVRGNFTDQADLDFFYADADNLDTKLRELDAKCLAMNGDMLKYVGTVAAVKDMVALSDYIDGPGQKINFWGFSYGTVIGSYFVNMYPDRVGRIILDGVVDPTFWAQHPPHLGWGDMIQSIDETFEGYALACATAGPAGCAIATPTSTPPDILKFITDLIDKAYDYYKLGFDVGGFKSSLLREYIFSVLYLPEFWGLFAQYLVQIDQTITTALTNQTTKRALLDEGILLPKKILQTRELFFVPDYSHQAITCADATDRTNVTSKEVLDEILRVTRQVSPTFGAMWGSFQLACHRWSSRAVERYQGPWNKVLANPILVIGNEADPVTPFASAKFVADQLGDSAVLVQQDDYGHCSLAMHSNCTENIIKNYFTTGVLPTSDQFCATNMPLFPNSNVTKLSLKRAISTNLEPTSPDRRSDIPPASIPPADEGDRRTRALSGLWPLWSFS